jgi:hypothetical protein
MQQQRWRTSSASSRQSIPVSYAEGCARRSTMQCRCPSCQGCSALCRNGCGVLTPVMHNVRLNPHQPTLSTAVMHNACAAQLGVTPGRSLCVTLNHRLEEAVGRPDTDPAGADPRLGLCGVGFHSNCACRPRPAAHQPDTRTQATLAPRLLRPASRATRVPCARTADRGGNAVYGRGLIGALVFSGSKPTPSASSCSQSRALVLPAFW